MAESGLVIDERIRIPVEVFDFDLESFRRWVHSDSFPQQGRISFFAGEIDVDMSPEEIETHNKVKSDIHVDLGNWVRAQNLGELLLDGALLVNEDAGLATEPDMMLCSWGSLELGLVRYREIVAGSGRYVEVTGSPDLTVEVVSRTSVRKDTVVLPELYFVAGVREYWRIDARGPEIDLQIFHRGDTEFVATKPDRDGFHRSEVLHAQAKLLRERNRRGTFQYRLILRRRGYRNY